MISFENVDFSYNDNQIIKNLSFKLNDGESLLITGRSGCGKTTVARLILGLLMPDSGKISAPEKISTVFQEDRLISKFNVRKNIYLPLSKHRYGFADKLISEFGFDDIANSSISRLSGGMKRRIAIIRAIAYGGNALILDEPFNGIDSRNVSLIKDIIMREYTEKSKSVIIISHNKSDVVATNSKILEL